MRNIILIAIVLFMSSCGYDEYRVRLANGSIVTAIDENNRRPEIGDTVYMASYRTNEWSILNQEVGADTMYINEWINADSTREVYISTRRSGRILRAL